MTIATFTNRNDGVRATVTYVLGQYRVAIIDTDVNLEVGAVTRATEADAIAYAKAATRPHTVTEEAR